MDAVTVIAVVAAVVSTVGLISFGLVDVLQWRGIRALKSMAENQAKIWEERGSMGEQIGEWLMEPSGDGKPSNLEVLASVVGVNVATSMRNSVAGQLSGDVRLEKSIEKRVQDYFVNIDPQLKDLSSFAELLGIPQEHLGLLARVLQRVAPQLGGAGGTANNRVTSHNGEFGKL